MYTQQITIIWALFLANLNIFKIINLFAYTEQVTRLKEGTGFAKVAKDGDE